MEDNIKHLTNEEAVEKMRELAKDQTCMFTTFTGEYDITVRPMATQAIEDDGSFWFFSGRSSHKNQEIQRRNKVQLMYAHPGKYNFLSVEGEAEISTDKEKIHELWTPLVKTWFQEGVDDPEITLIKVTPHSSYYWDTKHGKMVAFAKYIASIVAGRTMDDSIEGKLKV